MSVTTLKILNIKRHDTLPVVKGILTTRDPNTPGVTVPVDITGSTIKFFMVTDDATRTIKVNGVATITDAVNGKFEYSWVGTDTDTSGDYLAEFEITFTSGGKLSVPADDSLKIRIRDDFDNA